MTSCSRSVSRWHSKGKLESWIQATTSTNMALWSKLRWAHRVFDWAQAVKKLDLRTPFAGKLLVQIMLGESERPFWLPAWSNTMFTHHTQCFCSVYHMLLDLGTSVTASSAVSEDLSPLFQSIIPVQWVQSTDCRRPWHSDNGLMPSRMNYRCSIKIYKCSMRIYKYSMGLRTPSVHQPHWSI